jgi:hypothetical protein
MKSTGARK